MAKYTEYIFRRWPWLFISTILVAGLAVFLSLQAPAQYQSDATFWTERPTFLEYDLGWSPELSPAQNQLNQITQMLQIGDFQDTLTSRIKKDGTTLPANFKSKDLAKAFKLTVTYRNLISSKATAATPELARAENQALFDTYRENYLTQFQKYTDDVLAVYDGRAKDFSSRYEKSDGALSEYLASHPTSLTSAVPDFELERLKSQNQFNIDQLSVVKGKMELIKLQAQVGLGSGNTLFRLQEKPSLSVSSESGRYIEMAIYGLAGALVGLGLALVALWLVSTRDHSYFRANELAAVLGVPVYEIGDSPVATYSNSYSAALSSSVEVLQEKGR